MADNVFNSLSFDYMKSSIRKDVIENEEKKELKKQLKRIAILLDSEHDLQLKLNGINDVDIERLIYYLKFDNDEIFEDDSNNNTSQIKLNEIPTDEILKILNIHKKNNEKHNKNNLVSKKLWNFNKKLEIKENSKNVKPLAFNENYKITENLDNMLIKYKFIHNNKITKISKNNKEIEINTKKESDDKYRKKNFNFNRKFTLL
ncbi:Hypothetical protein SRAE_2000256000 [Strongyloides ratti]|uniref:Uncharacterized protein n=1 Tax=Strongyloides ratti TaxID=34506 RepID=A0A090LIC7_STRRB|nr:Hypothetical protein SRAE_2000256000 [Strongyloides ratti]CEF67898.1 Hypothetical protein SRAE_2000256000 [Strongyloides ratti]